MSKHSKQTAGVVICMIMNLFSLQAQFSNVPKYEIGIAMGGLIYQGDLAPSVVGSYKTVKPLLALNVAKLLSSSFALRANLAVGGLKGDETKYREPAYRQQRAFRFRSSLVEIAGQLVWNPLSSNYTDRGLSPYVFTGLGLGVVKIKRDWSNMNTEVFDAASGVQAGLHIDAEHALPRVVPVLPVGIGLRYSISPRIAINAESSYRFTNTDYLDGFSQAANPAKKDQYYTHTIGLVYRVGKKNMLGCPVVKY